MFCSELLVSVQFRREIANVGPARTTGGFMKTTSSFVWFVLAMAAVVIGLTMLGSEKADEAGAPIYLTEIP